MNQEQITKLIDALELGRDAAHEVAQRFHEEMKGYREAEHKQVDKDVADLNEAIAMLEAERALLAAAPAPIQQVPTAWCTDAHFEAWCERHDMRKDRGDHRQMFDDAASLYLTVPATPPALAGSQVQAAGDAGKVQAIKAAVSAIYFDDSSDYKTALWEVVQALDSAMAKLLEENPSAAYSQADAATMREQQHADQG